MIGSLSPAPLNDYWLTVFKNCEVLNEEVREQDEPIFKSLTSVRFFKGQENGKETQTFEFKFSPNEYFTNEVLNKKFFMNDDDTANQSEGTEIQWKEGKNVTVKVVKKK